MDANDAAFATSCLPTPLLSGMSVLQGRLAESIANASMTQEFHLTKTFDTKTLQSVLRRCQEVKDARLECLVQLLLLLVATINNDSSTSAPQMEQQQASLLRILAEGCYYRATHFTPDAPPIWKRIVDLHIGSSCQSHDNWRAVVALEHLQLIAINKSNHKRALELGLTLAECVMSVADDKDEGSSNVNDSASPLTKFYLQTLIHPHRPIEPYSLLEATQKAIHYLKSNYDAAKDDDDNGSAIDNLRRRLLALRISLVREQALVEQVAETDYTAARNRSMVAVSKRDITVKARHKHLVAAAMENEAEEDATIHEQATNLWITLLAADQGKSNDEDGGQTNHDTSSVTATLRIKQANVALQTYLTRQQDQAKALANSKQSLATKNVLVDVWRRLQEYCLLILNHVLDETQESAIEPISRLNYDTDALVLGRLASWLETSEHYQLVQHAVCSLFFTEWMLSGVDPSSTLISLPLLHLAQDVMQSMLSSEQNAKTATSSIQGNLVESGKHSSSTLSRLECAFRSARAWLYLSSAIDTTSAILERNIVAVATKNLDDVAVFADAIYEFGMSYLEFLVCWSGLFKEAWTFCIMAEARSILLKASTCVNSSVKDYGRPLSLDERAILDIASADAELDSGGLMDEAKMQYKKFSDLGTTESNSALSHLIMSKCIFALCGLSLRANQNRGDFEATIRSRLAALEQMQLEDGHGPFFMWRRSDATSLSLQYHLAAGRQLLADVLLRSERALEAQSFLEQAATDSPSDPGALQSLGTFHLRMLFFANEGDSVGRSKLAQAFLLRAAKADPTRASPFALLGYWYEHTNDIARATGCYSKALMMDPSHPVAGRGLIRLKGLEGLHTIIEKATAETASLNGWAWFALGVLKMKLEGNDDLAIVSFVAALRCRDIMRPWSDNLSYFYSDPQHACPPSVTEMVAACTELAGCYRRAGRYTASARCYDTAIDAAGSSVSNSILCCCAQVQYELGLFEEASENFISAVQSEEHATKTMALYGLGLTLLAIAKRHFEDGKAGAAFDVIRNGIDYCNLSGDEAACVLKLNGDLHTFATNLPPDLFSTDGSDEDQALANQVLFVREGIDYFRRADIIIVQRSIADENINALRASLASDIGSTFLSLGQLLAHAEGKGLGLVSTSSIDFFLQAKEAFILALRLFPEYSPAWCGLGCSVSTTDALMAQHAFSRSIELESLSPDAYSNLSFLYTSNNAVGASRQMSDAVTKIGDTPFMWINRALLAERDARSDISVDKDAMLVQAADAYRAALQVSTTLEAKEGLAMTCRVSNDTWQMQNQMSHLLAEYIGSAGTSNVPAQLFLGLTEIETGLQGSNHSNNQQFVEEIRKVMNYSDSATQTLQAIDVQTIAAVLKEHTAVACVVSSDAPTVDIARKVFYEPDRGELWLALGKSMLHQDDDSPHQLHSAWRALCKGRRILTESVVFREAKAEDLSDALALEYWIGQVTSMPCARSVDAHLQKSLLLNPGNSFARDIFRESKLR
ncbi:hypothetical protein MPSEU_000543500 [Mayamaea pseudoterrestris]|nr:hypothetical protein MPSEU_000543500 [Mayamaea pseudoterrestris]